MDAVKTNIRKALAVLLCACLLLTYNPAFGTAGTAHADEGQAQGVETLDGGHLDDIQGELNAATGSMETIEFAPTETGEATTNVNVSTFDNSLRSACREDFAATLQELRDGSANGNDVSKIWFEVTGGTPGSGSDPYSAQWEVYDDGALDQVLTNWIKTTDGIISTSHESKVATYLIDVQKIAKSSDFLKDDHSYKFVGTFTDASGKPEGTVTRSVTLYTVSNNLVQFKWGTLPHEGNDALSGVEVEGYRADGTKLTGDRALPTNPASQAMENKAAQDTLAAGSTGNYVMGTVYQLGTDPVKLPGVSEDLDIPPFSSDRMQVRLLIDSKYVKSDGNPNGYAAGDTIRVLWAGGTAGQVVAVNATVKEANAEKSQWWAEIEFPFNSTESYDATWTVLPASYGIEYDTNRLPDDKKEEEKAEYFSVTVGTVTGGTVLPNGGTVGSDGKRYWRVAGTGASAIEQASYALTPQSMGTRAFTLTKLTLQCVGGNGAGHYDFMNNAGAAAIAGSLSTLKNTLTLTNAKDVFAPGSAWRLDATFEESTQGGETPGEPVLHSVTVSTKLKNGGEIPNGGVTVSYYDVDGKWLTDPSTGLPAKQKTITGVLSTGNVMVSAFPPTGVDGSEYELTGVTMKVGSGAEEAQAFSGKVITVPATEQDVVVTLEFAETSGGGATTQPLYNVTISVINGDHGTAVANRLSYGDDALIPAVITFHGTADDDYVEYVNVYKGSDPVPERIELNKDKEREFVWGDLLNYHADILVEAYFNNKQAPSIELTMDVKGHGTVTPFGGWNLNLAGTTELRSGQPYSMLFVPEDGYQLGEVTLRAGTKVMSLTDSVQNNVWTYIPDAADRYVTVSVSFTKIPGGTPGGPGGENNPPSRVNVYVADDSLDNAANPSLAYLFDPPNDSSFESDVPIEGGDNRSAISVGDRSSAHGLVNGKTSIIDTVAYGGKYPLNLYGVSVGNQRYAVEKVLVVSYRYKTDSDGNQVKEGLKWSLYHPSVPYFEVSNVMANTDVIVYFAPVTESGGIIKPPAGGFPEQDFVHVTVSSNAPTLVTPSSGSNVPVLKGGQLPMKFVMENSEHVLQTAIVTPAGGESMNIRPALVTSAAIAGSNTATYLLKNVTVDTAVAATYEKKPEGTPTMWTLDAKVTGLDENGMPIDPDSASMLCSIAATSGSDTNYLNDGRTIKLSEGSDVRLALQRGYGYKLKGASFTWSDASVRAYVDAVTQDDGSVKRVVRFTTNEDELVGKKTYRSGDALYGTEEAPDESIAMWHVENLLCDVTLAPVYQKQAQAEVPDPDTWTLTTKVGTGLGQVTTDWPSFSGSTTKVEKGSVSVANPLTISITPGEGYRIKDVRVSSSSGNAFYDFWASLLNFALGDTTAEDMRQEAIASGKITLKALNNNYDVMVDFETIPSEYDPTGPSAGQVAVNVVYDPDRGTVTPNRGLTTLRTGSQQFVASPQKVGDKFYSVTAVKVQVGNGQEQTVQAIDKNSDLVRWDDEYPNVFVVDFSKLTWPSDDPAAAVTVEVLFSNTPDTPGTPGPGGSENPVAPGTPDPSKVKSVVVNLVTDGVPVVGDNGIGGFVSPMGAFELVPGTDYEQRVYVVPASGYELGKIEVARDGVQYDGVAYGYMSALESNGGYFLVSPDPVGTETITVYLKQKPLSERSYKVTMQTTGVTGSAAYVNPTGTVTLGYDKSQTFSIDPAENIWVRSVTDEYYDEANDRWSPLPAGDDGKPQGVAWNRASAKDPNEALNHVTVTPVKVAGKVVDRRITVDFQNSTGANHGIPEDQKVNLHPEAFGAGSEYLTFTPSEDMIGVWKGTADDPVSYNYRYELSKEATTQGYAIYRVQANGADVFGAADNVSDLKAEGEYTFTTENMRTGTNDTNTLFVYVKKFKNLGGNEPAVPEDPETTMTVEYGCGDGGAITVKGAAGDAVADSASGFKKAEVAAGEPFTVLMTPDAKHVLSGVYLHNCRVLTFNWVLPGDDRKTKVALEYTLQTIDESKPARIFAVYKKGNANTFKPWDSTQVGDNSFSTDGKLIVEITPAMGVEALVEMLDDMPAAGDMLQVSNPVSPFDPEVNVKDADESGADGYTVEFDTVSKLSEPGNVRILVGPLIKWNDEDNGESILYTLENIEGLDDFTVEEKPLDTPALDRNNEFDAILGSGSGDGAASQATQKYYTYYEINGSLPSTATDEGEEAETPVVRVNLKKLALSDGEFPEYKLNVPEGMVLVQAAVNAGEGTIVPVSTGGSAGSWFEDDTEGPWIVPEGTRVAFKVEAADGYVLSSLAVNDTDATKLFDFDTSTLTFTADSNSSVAAEFATEDSPEAKRTVKVEVQGSHGTTDPAPGEHQVKKGSPWPITFKPDTGYVPYRVWVDGVEGFVSPTTTGWMLPGSWSDQTFKVEFALAGTTPSGNDYLNQAGQNLLNKAGTTLVKTGDNPWLPVTVLLILLAGAATFGAVRMKHASEAAGRAAKYSVTRRRDE